MLGSYVLVAAAQPVVRVTTSGTPVWITAIVAVGAALLGSLVGGLVSYRANVALDDRRRRGRSQVRRKAKIYTPIRAELVALLTELEAGKHFGTWGITRKAPPPLIIRPASLHIWKDLIDDGRAETAASQRVRDLLGEVEDRADEFNERREASRLILKQRGEEILEAEGHTVRLLNWIDVDAGRLVRREFDNLAVLGLDYDDPVPRKVRKAFQRAWENDQDVEAEIDALMAADSALRSSVESAISELEAAMRRIARRYENESDED
jgi:hypothetical protein